MSEIHPTAILSPTASIAENVAIGPYVVIEGDVILGAGVKVDHHATVTGKTIIGAGCRIYPYALVGTDPQDLKYKGGESELVVGEKTMIREYVTISRGTPGGGLSPGWGIIVF